MFLPLYTSLLIPGTSTDPFPGDLVESDRELPSTSVYAGRSRETAVFDRFIALRVGEDLRRTESEFCEGGEGEKEIFTRLQVGTTVSVSSVDVSDPYVACSETRGPTA
jgi:hypothetical protein